MSKIGHIELPLHGSSGVGKFALVDADYDGEYFSQFRWYLDKAGYATRRVFEDGKQKSIYLHHEVLKTMNGLWRDHINRNKLDNRSCNLRLVTPKENAANRPLPEFRNNPNASAKKDGKSGSQYIGVRRNKNFRHGRLILNNTYWVKVARKYVGSFPSEEQAAQAYDREAFKLWGERANLNFPELLEAQRKDN